MTNQTSLKDNFSNDKARWDSLQQSLLGLYGKDVYTSWLQNISFTKINFNTLVLNVKTRFIRDWIVAHYADKILDLYKKQDPKPELFWNGVAENGRAMKSAGALACRYGDNVPFSPSKGSFSIVNYSITVSGMKGTLDGQGSTISAAHLNALKAVSGGKIAVQVRYAGTGTGYLTATFGN